MNIVYDNCFDNLNEYSCVFELIPNCFADDRGYFSEVLKKDDKIQNTSIPSWFTNLNWIKQINRSCSSAGTVRGCHAQKGRFCQGKLVEAINTKIYDIITDARPNSKTFGSSKVFILSPIVMNKLWVPRGFLHAFAVPKNSVHAIFQYYCDNVYNKQSEIGVNPSTLLPKIAQTLKQKYKDDKQELNAYEDFCSIFDNNVLLSEKDCNAIDYEIWMQQIKDEYDKTQRLWYL